MVLRSLLAFDRQKSNVRYVRLPDIERSERVVEKGGRKKQEKKRKKQEKKSFLTLRHSYVSVFMKGQ